MSFRTWVYMKLNPLFGTPVKVDSANYTRPAEIFSQGTVKYLETHEKDFQGNALIVGCGSGTEINWISKRVTTLTAVDVSEEAIEASTLKSKDLANVKCHLLKDKLPCADNSIDVIFMHNVCEHIIDLEYWFSEYFRVLKPNGIFINRFSPLFYSPFGAHMIDALKIPWGHLIFGLQTNLNVRNKYYPGELKASSWADIGLNRVTMSKYKKMIQRSEFDVKFFSYNTSMNIPLGWIPGLRNLFILEIINILTKKPKY